MRLHILLPILGPILFHTSLLIASAPAMAIYKCEAGGTIGYSDTHCPGARELDMKDRVAPADAAQGALRAKQQQAALHRIDGERQKETAHADKQRMQLARASAHKSAQCDMLAYRAKSRDDAVVTAAPKSQAKARTKARQAHEKFDMACAKSANPTHQLIN